MKLQSKLKACETELFGFMDTVYDQMISGQAGQLQPDPFCPEAQEVTDEMVAEAIRVWEQDISQSEIVKYPNYHNPAQGIQEGEVLVRTGFDAMPISAQRYLVYGMYAILKKYRAA